jgi:hypothetical protein
VEVGGKKVGSGDGASVEVEVDKGVEVEISGVTVGGSGVSSTVGVGDSGVEVAS